MDLALDEKKEGWISNGGVQEGKTQLVASIRILLPPINFIIHA